MSDKPEEKGRILELESEVARLRARLGEDPPGAPAGPEQPLGRTSRGKMIVFGAIILLLALAAFAGIFFTLSSGFDSLARKAAKTIVPDPQRPGSGSVAPERQDPPPERRDPAVPGL